MLLLICLFCVVKIQCSDITQDLEEDLELYEENGWRAVVSGEEPFKLHKKLIGVIPKHQNLGGMFSGTPVLAQSPILNKKEEIQIDVANMSTSELRDFIYRELNKVLTYLFENIIKKQNYIKLIKRQLVEINKQSEEIINENDENYKIITLFIDSLKKIIEEGEEDISENRRLVRKTLYDIIDMVKEDEDFINSNSTHSSYL